MGTFEAQYKKLNPAQREAVDAIDGPVMVIAGPGTGKTTILALRIAQILRKTDTPPSGILAITFTEAGVKAMRHKLRALMGSRADEIRLHTFHGFASSVIGEYRDHFTHLDKVTQLTDVDAEAIIRKILTEERFSSLRPSGNPDFYVGRIIAAISDAKREVVTPAKMKEFAEKTIKSIMADPNSISTRGQSKGRLKADAEKRIEKCERTKTLSGVYEAYEEHKKQARLMDFDDLILETLSALQKDSLLLRLLQEKFLYILVDEHQDTNDSQNLLLRLLADFFDSPNIFVVGDEKQAIYRFQGASVNNFLAFQKAWKKMKVISLQVNYRSHQNILDGAFSMIENNYPEGLYKELRLPLTAETAHEVKPIDIAIGHEKTTLDYLKEKLLDIQNHEPESTVAIIVKTNNDLERIIQFAEFNKISISSERKINIFKHPVGSLFFNLIEFLSDNSNVEAFCKTIAGGLWGLSFESGVEVIRLSRSGSAGQLEKISALRQIRAKLVDGDPFAFLVYLADVSGYLKIAVRNPSSMEVWRGITELAESLIREGKICDPLVLLTRLLSYRASAEERSVRIGVGTPENRVMAMTAHGSKGLEFDYVFIPFATEASWMGRTRGEFFVLPAKDKDEEDAVRDARRLFYVALTRARKHVSILVPSELPGGKSQMPLRFVDELPQKNVNRMILPENESLSINTSLHTPGVPTNSEKIVNLAKSNLLTKGLSVTALNHFLKCPSAFIYQSVLKIPQAPAPNPEKGKALHYAFTKIWAESDRSARNIEQTLKDSVTQYLQGSLLPVFEKEKIKKELFDDAPTVASELSGHFSAESAITESWSEGVFEALHAKLALTIPIHGQLDAIVQTANTVYVFDYKTKETMSLGEIKGETKSSNGDYMRQLVFYKFLLGQNAKFKGSRIIPTLVFAVPDRRKKCGIITLSIEEVDINKLKAEVQSLIDAVWSGEIVTKYCDEPDCEWCRLKKVSLST